ncbi:MAG: 30S ribosomal protein S20 [Clostridia bacterium]|nr:30S ribosomal protein S20 [Clostridia bacterium]MDH7573624.1 30S ribosomal protein S20 [Clostridia bacterium]
MAKKNKSALKRAAQAERRALRNRAVKSRTRTAIRRFREAMEQNDRQLLSERLREAVRVIDRAVTRGVLHKNTAARRKSLLYRLFNKKTAQT